MNDYKSIQDLIIKAALYDGVSTTICPYELISGDVLRITFSKGDRHSATLIDLQHRKYPNHEEETLYCCKRALRDLLFAPYEEIEVIKGN
jgi:hypothetical protein